MLSRRVKTPCLLTLQLSQGSRLTFKFRCSTLLIISPCEVKPPLVFKANVLGVHVSSADPHGAWGAWGGVFSSFAMVLPPGDGLGVSLFPNCVSALSTGCSLFSPCSWGKCSVSLRVTFWVIYTDVAVI